MDSASNSFATIESELESHGIYASNTMGVSMRPLFKTHRDMVILKKPEGELKKYDVALYRVREKYILHRVIAVREHEYIIRGDNTFKKEHIPKEAVIGVLIAFNRCGKRHEVTELGYKIYSRVWHYIYPLRVLYNFAYRVLAKIYRTLFKRRKQNKNKQQGNNELP